MIHNRRPSRRARGWTVGLAAGLAFNAPHLPAGENLLPNPSFEWLEPASPVPPDLNASDTPKDSWRPKTWRFATGGGARYALVHEPGLSRTGNHSLRFEADRGTMWMRYGPLPGLPGTPWSIRFWARGAGTVRLEALNASGSPWTTLQALDVELNDAWSEYRMAFRAPPDLDRWYFRLANRGPATFQVDDFHLSRPGVSATGLPPRQALRPDEHTLLHLDFESLPSAPAFFPEGSLERVDDGPPGILDRALRFGPDGALATSPAGRVDPAQGTIELWFYLPSPGNDRVSRNLLSITGAHGYEGFSMVKSQYGHVGFRFMRNWQTTSQASRDGYANDWAPGVWRHIAACWDAELLQVFVDGKLIAWTTNPDRPRTLGPILHIGSPSIRIADVRISNIVRYRLPVHAADILDRKH